MAPGIVPAAVVAPPAPPLGAAVIGGGVHGAVVVEPLAPPVVVAPAPVVPGKAPPPVPAPPAVIAGPVGAAQVPFFFSYIKGTHMSLFVIKEMKKRLNVDIISCLLIV